MIYRLIILFVVAMVFSVPAMAQKKKRPAVSQDVLDVYEAHSFEGVSYRLMKPIDLGNNADKAYPLILSLHGAGGKGKDNIRNLRNWNGYLADEQLRRKHPCFVVAPQSAGSWRVQGSGDHLSEDHIKGLSPAWRKLVARKRKGNAQPTAGNLGKVFKLLDSLTEEFNIDPDRIYVLGHSMGGFGTWTALGEAPSRFAAAIPTAGGLKPVYDVKTFSHVPIWTFHGSADTTVSPDLTREAFERLKAVQGNIKYTELNAVGHGANSIGLNFTGDDPAKGYVTKYGSDQCDRTEDIWDWLFAKSRVQPRESQG